MATFISVPGCGGGGGGTGPGLLPIYAIFADPNLEQVIRDALGQPTGLIRIDSLLGLTPLDVSGRGISNLNGLENCVHLENLSIGDNPNLVDLTPVENLVNLTDSDFVNTPLIVDSTPLCTCNTNGGLQAGSNIWRAGSGLAFPGDVCLDSLALAGVNVW